MASLPDLAEREWQSVQESNLSWTQVMVGVCDIGKPKIMDGTTWHEVRKAVRHHFTVLQLINVLVEFADKNAQERDLFCDIVLGALHMKTKEWMLRLAMDDQDKSLVQEFTHAFALKLPASLRK